MDFDGEDTQRWGKSSAFSASIHMAVVHQSVVISSESVHDHRHVLLVQQNNRPLGTTSTLP
jgi:hypothetical protein